MKYPNKLTGHLELGGEKMQKMGEHDTDDGEPCPLGIGTISAYIQFCFFFFSEQQVHAYTLYYCCD
jgi:hypothetical protein